MYVCIIPSMLTYENKEVGDKEERFYNGFESHFSFVSSNHNHR